MERTEIKINLNIVNTIHSTTMQEKVNNLESMQTRKRLQEKLHTSSSPLQLE